MKRLPVFLLLASLVTVSIPVLAMDTEQHDGNHTEETVRDPIYPTILIPKNDSLPPSLVNELSSQISDLLLGCVMTFKDGVVYVVTLPKRIGAEILTTVKRKKTE